MSSFNPEDLLGQQVSFLGKISRIIYSQNHPITPGTFCIFSIEIQEVLEGELIYSSKAGDMITCKGEVPSLKFGVPYKIIGELVESKYGFQYNILTMNTSFNLSSEEDQRNFFEYILPSAQVKLLFDNFDNPVELLKNKDISKLTSVKGIGLSKAYAMIQKYEDNQDKGMAYAQLKEYGLTKNAIDKLVKVYKYPEVAVEKVKENPYILIEEVNGFGWRKCDEIAAKAGIGENEESRIKAYVKYYLTDQAESNGHTWVTKDNLIEAIFSEAPNIDGEYLSNILKGMIASGILWKDDERVALMRYRKLEEKIAEELLRINNGPMEDLGDVEKVITEAEFEVGYSYTDEQKQAIKTILSNKICILTAPGGTGKTSAMYPVVKAMLQQKKNVEITALSGKASLNLANITGIEGKTIHRLLCINPMTGKFLYDKDNKLPVDMIILDELSMVGGDIFYDLIQSIGEKTRLVMLGDDSQLEAIGLCNLLKDIKNSSTLASVTLSKILRQAAKSGILYDSFKIRSGEQFIPATFTGETIHGELQDFKIIAEEDGRRCAIQAIEEYKKLLLEKKIPVNDITIITCKRSIGETSARAMNEYIQKIANPCQKGQDNLTYSYKDGSISYDINYRVGDRVLVTKNSYNTPLSNGIGEVDIFNGNLGTIKWIMEEQKIMGVEFPVGEVVLKQDKINDLQLGYAITCHKAQGSTIPYVIALCTNESYVLNSKEMLYTQITRAKKYCCLIGQTNAIRASVKTSKVKKKQTFLTEILQEKFSPVIDKADKIIF